MTSAAPSATDTEDTRLLRTHSDPEEVRHKASDIVFHWSDHTDHSSILIGQGGGACGSPLPTPSPAGRRKSYIPGLGTTSSKFASVVEDTIKLNGAAHPVKEVR